MACSGCNRVIACLCDPSPIQLQRALAEIEQLNAVIAKLSHELYLEKREWQHARDIAEFYYG